MRERQRQQKYSELQDEIDDLQFHHTFEKVKERSYKETDWGDEASYLTLSKETVATGQLKSRRVIEGPPKFGEQHFWGFGWWEHVKNKLNNSKRRK